MGRDCELEGWLGTDPLIWAVHQICDRDSLSDEDDAPDSEREACWRQGRLVLIADLQVTNAVQMPAWMPTIVQSVISVKCTMSIVVFAVI